jgi:NADH:ubiquinone oxidoreductase subunit 5 (subunit L)/multisubunit Na+/H+ antiporter MnhA subunit
VIGAASICGLPPLAGFSGEFLIYLAAFEEEASSGGPVVLPPLAVLTGLAMIGGLAVYAFSKAAGLTFLGAPRDASVKLRGVPSAVTAPLVILAAFCCGLGLAAPYVVGGLEPALALLTGVAPNAIHSHLAGAVEPLASVTLVSGVFLFLVFGFTMLRSYLLGGRPTGEAGTWDCGYAAPAASMQYTGSSYGQSIADLLSTAVGHTRQRPGTLPYFPGPNEGVRTQTEDVAEIHGYRPVFDFIFRMMNRGRILQGGRVHLYVLYIMLTLLVILIWYGAVVR